MRARLAAMLTRRLYRNAIIGDVPRSKLYFLLAYGTWTKVLNLLRVRADYLACRTTVRSRPSIVRAEPLNRCNLRCPLCPTGNGELDRAKTMMSPATLEAILARCGDAALYTALWIWGEPLLNKRLAELVAVCNRRGVGTEVSSHLSLPLSDQRIDELICAGLDWLIVSVDASTAPTYEKYRIGGSFEQVVRNMKAIVARKRHLGSATPFVEWQFVPLRHNEHEMRDAERLAREIGVDGVRFKPARLDKTRNITFSGVVPDSITAKWSPGDPRLVHTVSAQRSSFLDQHCSFLWFSVSVHGDGSIAPCCETTSSRDDLGNILDAPFDEIWNGATYVHARRVALGLERDPVGRATACQGCKVFNKPLAVQVEEPEALTCP